MFQKNSPKKARKRKFQNKYLFASKKATFYKITKIIGRKPIKPCLYPGFQKRNYQRTANDNPTLVDRLQFQVKLKLNHIKANF